MNKRFRSVSLANEHEHRSRSFDCVRERSLNVRLRSFLFACVRLCSRPIEFP
ncbi:hypothetical protein Hanom_Chr15g01397071 [Helianthus anomalus]